MHHNNVAINGCVLCWYTSLCYLRAQHEDSWQTDMWRLLADHKGPPPCFALCKEAGYDDLYLVQRDAHVELPVRRASDQD